MIRLTNKELLHPAGPGMDQSWQFNNVIFTDESTVALEQFAQR
jgi:hypothetical protein